MRNVPALTQAVGVVGLQGHRHLQYPILFASPCQGRGDMLDEGVAFKKGRSGRQTTVCLQGDLNGLRGEIINLKFLSMATLADNRFRCLGVKHFKPGCSGVKGISRSAG